MPDPNVPPDPEPTEPTVHELLLARIDEHCRLLGLELGEVAKACEQLAPEQARSCRNALTMCRVMVDEIRLRSHAPPTRRARTRLRPIGLTLPPVGLRVGGPRRVAHPVHPGSVAAPK